MQLAEYFGELGLRENKEDSKKYLDLRDAVERDLLATEDAIKELVVSQRENLESDASSREALVAKAASVEERSETLDASVKDQGAVSEFAVAYQTHRRILEASIVAQLEYAALQEIQAASEALHALYAALHSSGEMPLELLHGHLEKVHYLILSHAPTWITLSKTWSQLSSEARTTCINIREKLLSVLRAFVHFDGESIQISGSQFEELVELSVYVEQVLETNEEQPEETVRRSTYTSVAKDIYASLISALEPRAANLADLCATFEATLTRVEEHTGVFTGPLGPYISDSLMRKCEDLIISALGNDLPLSPKELEAHVPHLQLAADTEHRLRQLLPQITSSETKTVHSFLQNAGERWLDHVVNELAQQFRDLVLYTPSSSIHIPTFGQQRSDELETREQMQLLAQEVTQREAKIAERAEQRRMIQDQMEKEKQMAAARAEEERAREEARWRAQEIERIRNEQSRDNHRLRNIHTAPRWNTSKNKTSEKSSASSSRHVSPQSHRAPSTKSQQDHTTFAESLEREQRLHPYLLVQTSNVQRSVSPQNNGRIARSRLGAVRKDAQSSPGLSDAAASASERASSKSPLAAIKDLPAPVRPPPPAEPAAPAPASERPAEEDWYAWNDDDTAAFMDVPDPSTVHVGNPGTATAAEFTYPPFSAQDAGPGERDPLSSTVAISDRLPKIYDILVAFAENLASFPSYPKAFAITQEVAVSAFEKVLMAVRAFYVSTLLLEHDATATRESLSRAMLVSNDLEWLAMQLGSFIKAHHPEFVSAQFDEILAAGLDIRARQVDKQVTYVLRLSRELDSFRHITSETRFSTALRVMNDIVEHLRIVRDAWTATLTENKAFLSLGIVVESVAVYIITSIQDLGDISQLESEHLLQIVNVLSPVPGLFSPASALPLYAPSLSKLFLLSEILSSSMAEIMILYNSGALADFTADELASLLEALFAESAQRHENVQYILANDNDSFEDA